MRLSVLIPDPTINYVTNPALRYDTTGWNAQGSTITRTLDRARFGIASLKVVTSGATLREGAFFRVSGLTGINEPITISVYVRGVGKARARLDNNVVGGSEYISQTIVLSPNRWTRVVVTGFSTGGNDMRLYVETDESTAISRTLYVDGAQMERKAYATTYCDGEQPGCRWDGLAHSGTSQRSAYTRAGGRWVQLAGEEREAENLYMTVAGGLGVAPIQNFVQEFSVVPGAYFQNLKKLSRPITLTFHAKHSVLDTDEQVSLAALHQLRELLIDVVKPDRTGGEDVWFEYLDAEIPFYFQARYEGGLEGEWDIRNQFINSFPLRLLAVSPMMVEDSQEVKVLDFQDSRPANEIFEVIGRINGEWNNMNYGIGGSVGDLELDRKGELYAAGSFDLVNFSTNRAIDPNLPSNDITYWDGTQWRSISTGSVSTIINDIAVAPNGDVYATGTFSTIGGVAANNIAKWNGSAWSALGSGLNNDGLHVSVASNGWVYVGGAFTTAGGITAGRIAYWDGTAWHAMGQYSGFDADVYSIAILPNGIGLYVGGIFTNQRGLISNQMLRIASYDLTTDRFTQVGQGFNQIVREVVLDNGGVLYACGDFTASGTSTINRIGKFLGGAWLPLGSGMDGPVLSFDVGVNGDIVAVGQFNQAGGVYARGIALWNGSTWTHLDIDLSVGDTTMIPLASQYKANGDLHISGTHFYTAGSLYSAINYVDNVGSAEAMPIVYISGPGRMRWLENQSTKKRIFFDLVVQNNEEVFLDFEHGLVFSTVRGNLLNSILPGSDFHSFSLLPGENKLAVFMTNDVNAQMQMRYTPTHWGTDPTRVAL